MIDLQHKLLPALSLFLHRKTPKVFCLTFGAQYNIAPFCLESSIHLLPDYCSFVGSIIHFGTFFNPECIIEFRNIGQSTVNSVITR